MAGHAASTERDADKDVAVLLCGSRDSTDEDAVRAQLERAVARFGAERLVVIAGGARGADRQAEACARAPGLAVEVYPARWDRHGRSTAAGAVVDSSDARGYGARQVWLYATILTVGYMISRGLAKSGSRDPYDTDGSDREHPCQPFPLGNVSRAGTMPVGLAPRAARPADVGVSSGPRAPRARPARVPGVVRWVRRTRCPSRR
jgi:YspA, cpYpsA-related SLOG family